VQRILRLSLCLVVALAAVGLAACGGKAGEASSQDVNSLLTETFSGKKDIKSGKLALDLKIDVKGGSSGVNGPIAAKLGGPFESQGAAKLPKFDLDVSFEGAGQSFKAGATSTGDKAFVSFQGQEYVLSDQTFTQLRTAYEQAAKQGTQQKGTSLQTLGLDPTKWLKNARNAGDAKVGDTDTVKITGDVDVAILLDDISTALTKAGQLGLSGQAQVPTKLTDEQKRQVQEALKDVKVEIYTGADDKILRRMLIVLNVVVPKGSGGGSAGISFDLSLLNLNEGQDIKAPSGAKPFEELLGKLGGAGGLLGGAAGGGSASGSGSGSAGSTASQEDLKKFTDCLTAAGSDQAKAAECAKIIKP
jgi:hypothetical protein